VTDVTVVGPPDERFGESVAAFIRDTDPTNPASDEELRVYLRERLAPHKAPRSWYHVADFPLTASGKIQKFALVEGWERCALNAQGQRPRSPQLAMLAKTSLRRSS
jgi:fatty-acyl-CoA synthase